MDQYNQHQRWTNGKDYDNIHQFKQRDGSNELHEILKSSGGRGWSQWWYYIE